jgi:hypothetical protein
VLLVASGILVEFSYCVSAEHSLARAARAGAWEATLPRATRESIAESVRRRLRAYSFAPSQLQIGIEMNGAPILGHYTARDGDTFAVAVSLPASAVAPRWSSIVLFWHGESRIQARAQCRVPSRELRLSARN